MTAALPLLLTLIVSALTDARSLRTRSSAESLSAAEAVQGLNRRFLVDTTRPFALVNGERTSLRIALQDGHPEQLQCGLEFGGRLLILELEKNHLLLPKQPSVFYYLPNGTGLSLQEHPVTHCFYHGRVRGLPESRAALSTCSGLRGVIILNATLSLELQPEEQETGSKVLETGSCKEPDVLHLLFSSGPAEGARETSCGVTHTAPPTSPQQHHRRRRDVLTETKYIELVLVVDHQEFLNYQKNNKTIIYRMLDVANQVDWFYRPLNVRVALTGLEIWSDRDKIHIEKNPTETLHNFLQWRSRDLLPRIRHDNAQLIMGGSFDGTTVGMASQSSMCSRDRSGGVNVDHLVSVLGVASTVAHELGHNLGMSHDSAERRCQCDSEGQSHSCIMEPSTGLLPGQSFSSCSLEDLSFSLLHGAGMCLFNVPSPESLLGGPRCGNLYLEPGEECDCGLLQECLDPCCNASTCRLVSGAQCSSNGVCCSDCQLRAAGYVCRLPLGECDLPEFCSGTSPHCPPNVYLQNGEPCLQGASYCYGGVCATLDQQCQILWGPNSTRAPDVCFSSVNKQGNQFGNCGQLSNGSYLPCPDQDVLCGRVQCRGGTQRPLLSSAEILTTTVHSDLDEDLDLVCRGTYLHLGQDVSDPASVSPGTRCGPGKVCLDQRCQEDSVFRVEECRQKCHGHGVCNSNGNCHCDDGWAPPDCVSSGTGGSTDSGPTRSTRDSSPVRVALLVLFLLVLPLLVLVLVWPRIRRLLRHGAFPQSKLHQHRTPRGDRRNVEQVMPLRFHALAPPPGEEITIQAPPHAQVKGRPAAPCKPLPPDPAHGHASQTQSQPAVPLKPLPLPHRHGNSITPEVTFNRPPPLPPIASSHSSRASQMDRHAP
ncbi:disintegrin and metalloproteinase domain-containing protein 15 isoform X2 [Boleophthalmus pectinirostris]|uniref:disintegrin and metalloproteinase domain-containing protein 15 isoform X2 n=1 Tax=Boleophthalmus pectinirostris TaxID=150288 RepID=UPI000A1C29CC|nr:disintegrin and metalloproteinase domain-containing protein 15 isoform X2 [Boleophthalmus pectinirostris]